MLLTPLEQFDVVPTTLKFWLFFFRQHQYQIFNLENIIFLFLLVVLGILYLYSSTINVKTNVLNYQTRWALLINTLVKDIAQAKIPNHGLFNVFILTLFLFIVLSNWIGLIAFGYTITAVIIIPFILSISAFTIPNYAGYKKFNIIFLSFFKPEGIAWILKPMLIVIELISHTIRTLSLAVRLFANMFAGHVLIYILSTTILLAIVNPWIPVVGGIILNIIYLTIYSLETFIAVLQAYVFTALLGIYFTETMNH